MTRREWLEQAAEWDRKAADAYRCGDTRWGEVCEQKANSSRFAADYALEQEQDN